jgi:hypothetical protein
MKGQIWRALQKLRSGLLQWIEKRRTEQAWEDADEDIGERVQQHHEDTGPQEPVTGRRVVDIIVRVLETEVGLGLCQISHRRIYLKLP